MNKQQMNKELQQLRQMAQPSLQVTSPINDVQLLAMVAATVYRDGLTPAEAVAIATDILVEAVVNHHIFGQKVQARVAEHKAKEASEADNGKEPSLIVVPE